MFGDVARGLVVEEAVKADSLLHGEECWISNGTRGFVPAVVSLGQPSESDTP